MLGDKMLASFGFPKPLPFSRTLIEGSLKLRGKIVRLLPPRKKPHFFTDDKNRTYLHGYAINKLGPPTLTARQHHSTA